MADLQKHLQVLRQRLDDSIRLYYYRQKQAETNRSSNGGRSIISDIMKNRRILHMLHQDETNACIQISLV
ncbi:Thiamine-phosphate synthase [Dirofilaria immitis]